VVGNDIDIHIKYKVYTSGRASLRGIENRRNNGKIDFPHGSMPIGQILKTCQKTWWQTSFLCIPRMKEWLCCWWIDFNHGYEQSKIFLLGDERFWMTIEHNIEGKHPK
jgi:hypothetical protein